MVLELQRADRMRDPLDRVGLAVGEIVGRVDAPLVAAAMVRGVQDAVHHRVAHVQVGRGHVDLRPQGARAVGKLAGPHPLEQVEVLLDRAVAVGAVLARLGQRAAMFADFVGRQVADVRLAGLDQLHGPLVNLLEIVGGVVEPVLPIEAQPADVLHDRVDVLDVFFAGVGVVEPQVAQAAELLGDAEVQADRLGVADVQIAVGLGRETGIHPPAVFAGAIVLLDDRADEVGGRGGIGCIHVNIRGMRNGLGGCSFDTK